MPELPEVEALRRRLDGPLAAAPVARAGPAHVATLKTITPALSELDGRTLAGAQRRGKHLLLPTVDGELVLHVHQMTNGRLSLVASGAKHPKSPAFRLELTDGTVLVMTEVGSRKQARVGLYAPREIQAELAHLGPEADTLDAAALTAVLVADSRRLHALLRDQRALAGIGRAWANEILHRARLSPYALSTDLAAADIERLAGVMRDALLLGTSLRAAGAGDAAVYRIHGRLGQPCPACETPIAQVDFEQHTIYYCPACQTDGRVLKDRRLSRLLR